VILAHNYQVPEVQEVADFVGDSLGPLPAGGRDRAERSFLRRALHGRDGVDPLARTRPSCSPTSTPGCSLADTITAEQLRAWKAKHPGAVVVMYVNTSAEVKAETDYCVTSSNAVPSSSTSTASTATTRRSSSGPTCSSARTSRR
jgi:quinolinate synthase